MSRVGLPQSKPALTNIALKTNTRKLAPISKAVKGHLENEHSTLKEVEIEKQSIIQINLDSMEGIQVK